MNDAAVAKSTIGGAENLSTGVRVARNSLGIEAVSVVDPAGTVVASTSASLVGSNLSNQLLLYGATSGRFTALAGAIPSGISLDGVLSWPAGSILYQVISPISPVEGSVFLHYDITSLLERRARPGELQPETAELFGLALLFLLISGTVLIGRGRAARRYESLVRESDLLRDYSERLEKVNVDLATARDRAEEALALAEEKIRIRSEFVLMINHELRTPLTSVVTGAELILGADLAESERESLLESMVTDGNRLLEIIDQILAVARIENRGLSKELTDVGLDQLCKEIKAEFDPRAWQTANGTRSPMVRTDSRALKLVVHSLLDNAYTHGATRATVRLAAKSLASPTLEVGQRPDDAVFVVVEDDGPGIDANFLPRIFEKFEKSSFSSGTGLGLYMARMVIEAIHGSLAVASSTQGTQFQIAIPLSPTKHPVGVTT